MNYEEAVAYIEETPKFTTKNKLEHTKECLRRLGNPQKQFQVVHVAGTNGKGSTCAFLTSVFREAGYSCGLFTSPHLVVINERFQIIEKNISKLFLGHKVVCAYPYRIMRYADLSFYEDEAEDLLKEFEKSLMKRQWGEVIRLEVEYGIDTRQQAL